MTRLLVALASLLCLGPSVQGETPAPQKVLFVGNSLTLHGPKADIDWHGNWGMAASAEDKDYVHLVLKALASRQGLPPASLVVNVADFERRHATYDLTAGFSAAAAFRADVIILGIGENVPPLKTPAESARYEERVVALIKTLRTNPQARVIVRSGFWPDEAKDAALRRACEAVGGTFVDIGALARDERNYARSERPFKHAGVANHPGDRGMAAIAEAILKTLPK